MVLPCPAHWPCNDDPVNMTSEPISKLWLNEWRKEWESKETWSEFWFLLPCWCMHVMVDLQCNCCFSMLKTSKIRRVHLLLISGTKLVLSQFLYICLLADHNFRSEWILPYVAKSEEQFRNITLAVFRWTSNVALLKDHYRVRLKEQFPIVWRSELIPDVSTHLDW